MDKSSNRSSIRQRTQKGQFDPAGTTTTWTLEEKQTLLIAIKKHGILQLKKLHEAVPTKDRERIWQYILMQAKNCRSLQKKKILDRYKKEVKQGVISKDASISGPLDAWMDKLKSAMPNNFLEDRAVSLAKSVQAIALFEKQPDPSLCGGVDFRAAYEFLYYAMMGLPPREMDPKTAKFMMASMSRFTKLVKKGKEKYKDLLQNTCSEPSFNAGIPDYSVPKCTANTSQSTSFVQLLNIPGFNPFCIPPDLLLKKMKSSTA